MTVARKPLSPAVAAGPSSFLSPAGPRPAARSASVGDLVQSLDADCSDAVAAVVGPSRRVVVNGKGNRYQVQDFHSGSRIWWGQFYFATKTALLAKFPGDAALAAAMAALPERPAGVCPEFVAERQRQRDAFEATNYGRDAYPWVVAQVEDWRLVVDPDRSTYRLMFVPRGCFREGKGNDAWQSSLWYPDLDVIRARVDQIKPKPFGLYSHLWGSHPLMLLPLLAALPRFPSDLDLPEMVARPVSVARQQVGAQSSGQSWRGRPIARVKPRPF